MTATPSSSSADTREALLRAAEALFADHGVAGASLRAITGAAGVNLAAVNYHFGSKEGLLRALLEARLAPLHRARLELLDACEAAGDPPRLECVVRAFVEPVVHLMEDGGRFARMMGRIYQEPAEETRTLLLEEFRPSVERFAAALARALPELPQAELLWRFHFMVGCVAQTVSLAHLVAPHFAAGICDPDDAESLVEYLTTFLTTAWNAPPARVEEARREESP